MKNGHSGPVPACYRMRRRDRWLTGECCSLTCQPPEVLSLAGDFSVEVSGSTPPKSSRPFSYRILSNTLVHNLFGIVLERQIPVNCQQFSQDSPHVWGNLPSDHINDSWQRPL